MNDEATAARKLLAEQAITQASPALIALSETLHAHPETAWQEHRAAGWVGDALSDAGFRVTPAYLGFDTALLAEAGTGPTTIGVMAEYDALPGLGHACGHNLIAASAVGAGLALARLADDLGLTVRVYGTPAEEGGGGKIELIDAGAFHDLDLAMMVHPAPVDVAEARPFAVAHSHITYDGVSAHAAAYPDEGVNANDAFLVAQVAIGLLRQQLPTDTRVHGIQTVGGLAPNAIPERTEGRWYVRANTLEELAVLEERVNRCFEAGALATGAQLCITPESQPYAEFRTDERALAAYKANAVSRGRLRRRGSGGSDEPRIDRHGERFTTHTGYPSLHRGGFGALQQPPEAIRCRLPGSRGRTGAGRRSGPDGVDSNRLHWHHREGQPIIMTTTDWAARGRELSIDGRAVINGRRVDSADGGTVPVISPASLSPLADLTVGTEHDIDLAVTHARQAFEDGTWSRIAAAERGRVLIRLADLIMDNLDELALLETLDSGKPIAQTLTVDVPGTAETFRWYGELADKRFDEIPATPPGSTALVRRVPLGVVGAIVPWNYPLEIAAWKLAPALAAGNSVILKPALETSLSALRLADLALDAGIPAGVLNVVPGDGSTVGSRIARHPDIDVLAFTGSTAVAKQLMIDAGNSNMKRLCLEAGGKSSNLVFADADLESAAVKAAFGAFYNQGQVCSANSRILVERSVHDEFVELLVSASHDYEPSDPLAGNPGNGSLISRAHTQSVTGAIERARADGTLVSGGDRLTITGSDAYLRPAIVTGLGPTHELHRNEIFGPLVAVLPFDTEDEALRLANATEFGLAGSVWTTDLSRAHRVSERLVAGTVSVNTVDALGLTTPFGGFGQSGFGRDLSRHAFDNYTDWKTTWFQHG